MSNRLTASDIRAAIVEQPILVTLDTIVTDVLAGMNQSICVVEVENDATSHVMATSRASCVLVMEGTTLKGIFTERDAIHLSVQGKRLSEIKISEVMTDPVITIQAADLTDPFLPMDLMRRHRIRHLPVLDHQGQVVGLITPESLQPCLSFTVQALQQQVSQLQADKLELLKNRTNQMEKLIQERTAELQVRTLRERLVSKISTHIRSSLNLPDVLNAAVTKVKAFLDCDRVSIYQVLPSCQAVVVADCAEPYLPSFSGLEVEAAWAAQWQNPAQSHQVLLVSDLNTTDISDNLRALLDRLHIRAGLLVPILQADQLWGILCASQSDQGRDWHPGDVMLLQQIATQLTFAVKQATAYQQAQAELLARRQTEAILLQSQQRYAFLTEASPVGIFRTDAVGNCLYVNDRWCQIAGVSPNQVIEQNWMTHVHPADRPGVSAAWDDCARNHQPFRREFRFQPSPGQEIWVYGQAVAEFGHDGTIVSYVGTITDINDRKQAELSLQESETKYRLLVENQTDLIVKVDTDGNLVFVSPSYCDLFGKTEAELLNKPYMPLVHEEDRERTEQARQALRIPPYTCYLEQRVMTQEGWRWLGWSSKAVLDDQGKVMATVGVGRDITQLKQTQRALQRLNQELEAKVAERTAQLQASEAELRALFSAIPDTVVVRDRNGICLKVAPNSTNLVLPAENMVGKTLHETLPQPEADFLLARIQAALAQQHMVSTEYSVQVQDRLVTLLATIAPLTEDSVVIVGRDISDRQQAEQQLRQANAELMQATRMKDEFLANMSHELRTPLNAILGMAEGLQEEVFGPITPRQLKALKTIDRSGKHLLDLITDILDLSKIEAGKLDLELDKVSILGLCEASLSFVRQMALKKEIQVRSQVADGLQFIYADDRRLRQILINLLTNAVKFTPAGGSVTLEIQRGTSTQPPQPFPALMISVTDNGIGIAKEDLEKLFQSFVQIDSKLNRQQAGTGLGLALVKRLTELHGGHVQVTSELGQGSCFTVYIPYRTQLDPSLPIHPEVIQSLATGQGQSDALREASRPGTAKESGNQPASPLETSQDSSAINPATTPPLILLVEDQEANIITVSSYLESRGYQLLVATDGQQAVDSTKTHRPDVVLMDIQMPGMDGLEAIRLIRADPEIPNIPIIALTALAMEGDREKCLEAGASEYLSKPVRLKELVATIQRFM